MLARRAPRPHTRTGIASLDLIPHPRDARRVPGRFRFRPLSHYGKILSHAQLASRAHRHGDAPCVPGRPGSGTGRAPACVAARAHRPRSAVGGAPALDRPGRLVRRGDQAGTGARRRRAGSRATAGRERVGNRGRVLGRRVAEARRREQAVDTRRREQAVDTRRREQAVDARADRRQRAGRRPRSTRAKPKRPPPARRQSRSRLGIGRGRSLSSSKHSTSSPST